MLTILLLNRVSNALDMHEIKKVVHRIKNFKIETRDKNVLSFSICLSFNLRTILFDPKLILIPKLLKPNQLARANLDKILKIACLSSHFFRA